MKTYFFFLVLIYSFRSEAQYFNSGRKGCDSIHNDSLGSLIEFAYEEGVANYPFYPINNKETETYKKNPYPQIGKIHTLDYTREGNRKFGNVVFVKKDGSRKTLRTAAHNFFNLTTGKLYGPLSKVDIEINGEWYKVESISCGKSKGLGLDVLIKDQCEVTLKKNIPYGIEPLELDFDYLKTDPELTHFGEEISPILKPFQNEVAEWDKQINHIQTKFDELEKKIKKYKKIARDSEIVKIQNLLELEKQKKELEIQIKDLKSAREIPLKKILDIYPEAKKIFGIDLVGFHGFPEDWHDVISVNHCGYVYDRDLEFDDDIFSAQCNSSAGMSGAPLMHNRRVVGMVVSAGQANVDNAIIPPLPAEQLDVFVNSENEKDFL